MALSFGLAAVVLLVPVAPAVAATQSFQFPGYYGFNSPAGVHELSFDVYGSQSGAHVHATIPVAPAEGLRLAVGGDSVGTGSGSNGGGSPNGGGASDVERGPAFDVTSRVIVAGAGGGPGGPGYHQTDTEEWYYANGSGGASGADGTMGSGPPGAFNGPFGPRGGATAGGGNGGLGQGGAGTAGAGTTEAVAGQGSTAAVVVAAAATSATASAAQATCSTREAAAGVGAARAWCPRAARSSTVSRPATG